ncbi:MAG TPA: DNA repair protein RecO, partial [Pseudomonadales bacterium]|nr:DNA repair protein RecO [Pseudomonadales bacterium]
MPEERGKSDLREAFILHARKYRDTSMIVELLTRDEGRVPAVVRGVRTKNSRLAGHIRPFGRLLVSWYGRGELKTVRAMDFPWSTPELTGDALLTGLYVNELLVRLLGRHEPVPAVFDAYGPLVHRIALDVEAPAALRQFELGVLTELGYAITFGYEASSGEPVSEDAWYRYVPDEGFHRVQEVHPDSYFVRGADLIGIAAGDFTDPG